MPVLASPSMLEPGLVGLWRPVLVVPHTLFEHLSRPQIEAIVAHETSHFRRRDNLIAAVHMLVEALFWFHPIVWWIGARLIEERERACDEAVVRSGHDRAAYARSLVDCCRLYLQSPLPCVAGASGSRLQVRVQLIMTAPLSPPLPVCTRALLLAAGICAIASPVAGGWLTSPASQGAAAKVLAVVAAFAAAPPRLPAIDAAPAAARAPRVDQAVRRPALAVATGEAAERPVPDLEAVPITGAPASAPEVAPAPPRAAGDAAVTVASLEPAKTPTAVTSESAPAGTPIAGQARPSAAQSVAPVAVHVEAAPAAKAALADDNSRVCQTEAMTGSRFVKRLCMSRVQWQEAQRRLYDFERANLLDPSGYSPMSSGAPVKAGAM